MEKRSTCLPNSQEGILPYNNLKRKLDDVATKYQEKLNEDIEDMVATLRSNYESELRKAAVRKKEDDFETEKMKYIVMMLNAVTHLTNLINLI